jgi:SAM-dependent methyltransferase
VVPVSEYATGDAVAGAVSSDYHVRDDCRLCGDSRLEKLVDFGSTPLANELLSDPHESFKQERFPLYLVGCAKCGHVQLPVVVRAERLFPPSYPYQSGTSESFRKHLSELASTVEGLVGAAGIALDVACNDGTFVDLLRRERIAAYGVDPAAPGGDALYQAFFNAEWAKHNKGFDVVTALNVFAHVDDLNDFASGVSIALKHDGLFIFEVGYLPDIIAKRNYPVVYHEHLSYHHLTPLVPFFRRHGMTVVDAHRIDQQGGSIRVFVRNCEAFEQPTERMQALLDEENHPLRPGIAAGVASLKQKAKEDCDRLAGFAKQIQSARGSIAGYGAPAKLCTMLHASRFYAGQLTCVFDDNPLKVGKYVPGTRIPIVHSSELYGGNPDGLILFSSNFADEIKQKHQAYKGKWLVV